MPSILNDEKTEQKLASSVQNSIKLVGFETAEQAKQLNLAAEDIANARLVVRVVKPAKRLRRKR